MKLESKTRTGGDQENRLEGLGQVVEKGDWDTGGNTSQQLKEFICSK
jgi:hypothetical protein